VAPNQNQPQTATAAPAPAQAAAVRTNPALPGKGSRRPLRKQN